MNYRSVVAFGTATKVESEDALHGLRVITEQLVPVTTTYGQPVPAPDLADGAGPSPAVSALLAD